MANIVAGETGGAAHGLSRPVGSCADTLGAASPQIPNPTSQMSRLRSGEMCALPKAAQAWSRWGLDLGRLPRRKPSPDPPPGGPLGPPHGTGLHPRNWCRGGGNHRVAGPRGSFAGGGGGPSRGRTGVSVPELLSSPLRVSRAKACGVRRPRPEGPRFSLAARLSAGPR